MHPRARPRLQPHSLVISLAFVPSPVRFALPANHVTATPVALGENVAVRAALHRAFPEQLFKPSFPLAIFDLPLLVLRTRVASMSFIAALQAPLVATFLAVEHVAIPRPPKHTVLTVGCHAAPPLGVAFEPGLESNSVKPCHVLRCHARKLKILSVDTNATVRGGAQARKARTGNLYFEVLANTVAAKLMQAVAKHKPVLNCNVLLTDFAKDLRGEGGCCRSGLLLFLEKESGCHGHGFFLLSLALAGLFDGLQCGCFFLLQLQCQLRIFSLGPPLLIIPLFLQRHGHRKAVNILTITIVVHRWCRRQRRRGHQKIGCSIDLALGLGKSSQACISVKPKRHEHGDGAIAIIAMTVTGHCWWLRGLLNAAGLGGVQAGKQGVECVVHSAVLLEGCTRVSGRPAETHQLLHMHFGKHRSIARSRRSRRARRCRTCSGCGVCCGQRGGGCGGQSGWGCGGYGWLGCCGGSLCSRRQRDHCCHAALLLLHLLSLLVALLRMHGIGALRKDGNGCSQTFNNTLSSPLSRNLRLGCGCLALECFEDGTEAVGMACPNFSGRLSLTTNARTIALANITLATVGRTRLVE
eukprot:m.291390 g.291390  ORF g.291390 m.291390 type:complete len:582 (+) comp19474_c5_seq5:121-1866(+)